MFCRSWQIFSQNTWRANTLDVIAVQKVEAGYKKAAAEHEKFKDSLAKDPLFIQNMQIELQEIDSQISQLEQER